MNPEMFREYDIRGIAGKDMTENDVVLIGKGVGTFLREHGCSKLTVGRDCRLTSDLYAEKVIKGLRSTGCDVIDIGVCPTPVLYFSIQHLEKEGGVMVTASHNPMEYNGFKLCLGLDSIHGKDIQKILNIINENSFVTGSGLLSTADVITPYKEFVENNITIAKPIKVGVDGPSGSLVLLPITN